MSFLNKNHTNETYLAKWLNDEISDKELKNMVSENDFKAFLKIRNGLLKFEAPNFESDKLLTNIKSTLPKKKTKIISLKWGYAVAASIALLFSIYLFDDFKTINYQTSFGQQSTIALLDNSEVQINAKSTLSFQKNKWNKNREVNLKGEAFFKVKKGSSFTVKTTNGNVTVLGTQFTVNSQDNFFLVKCFEGKVRVVQNRDTVFLTKGKAFQNNHSTVKKWTFTEESPVWLSGESSFKSVALKVVITSLENQFGVKITSTPIDNTQVFTGSFSHDNLNIALKSVFSPMNIGYEIQNKIVVLSKK